MATHDTYELRTCENSNYDTVELHKNDAMGQTYKRESFLLN